MKNLVTAKRLCAASGCALAALLMAAAPVAADIVLDTPVKGAAIRGENETRFVLRYESRDPDGRSAGRIIREDRSEFFPDAPDGEAWIETRSPDLGVEGTLLALTGPFNHEDWQVEVEVLELSGNARPDGRIDARSCVFLAPVRAGTFHGIQVTIDPSRAVDAQGNAVRISRALVTLVGPAEELPSRKSAASEDGALRTARSIFLNSDDIRVAPTASGGMLRQEPLEVPGPPGDWRVSYLDGDNVMLVDLESVGATESDLASIRVDYHGEALPIGGVHDGQLWFYAPRRHTLDDMTDAVFVTVDSDSPSPMMATRPAFSTLSPVGEEAALTRTRLYRERHVYERFLPIDLGTRFAWYRIQNPPTGSFPNERVLWVDVIDRLTSNEVVFEAGVHGYNSTTGLEYDHFADFTLAGTDVPRTQWKGRILHEFAETITFDEIPDQPEWQLIHRVPGGTPVDGVNADIQFADYFRLTWTGYPRLQNGYLTKLELEEDTSPRRVSVGGFPPSSTMVEDIAVLDVTDPASPVRVAITEFDTFINENGTLTAEWEAGPDAAVFHVKWLVNGELPFDLVEAERLPDPTDGTTTLAGVYVRPPVYSDGLQPLIALRAGDDHTILELDPQAAYNAYNGGQESPDAIREALRDLLEASVQRVAFPDVILVGHGSLDPRDYLRLHRAPQVPVFRELSIETNGNRIENNIDYPYALLFGDDMVPDVRLSRIHPPSLSLQDVVDLDTAVERILAYEAIADDLRSLNRPGLFVADEAKGLDDFPADQALYINRWQNIPGRGYARIDRPDFPNLTAMFEAVRDAIAGGDGKSFVMYTGHGFNNQWASSQMLTSARVPEIDTVGKWPIVTTFTCLNGYFALPGSTVRSLSEAWLFTRDSEGGLVGAVANIAPVSVDFYDPQKAFAIEILDVFKDPPATHPEDIGDLFFRAQSRYAVSYPFWDKTLREYILFGDPSTDLGLISPEDTEISDWWILQ